MFDFYKPLVPKNSRGPLRVVILGRLSKPKGTAEDTELTIESSMAVARKFLERVYQGPIEFICLSEQISGMVPDRATIREARDYAESGSLDVVIGEELRCMFRNPRLQYAFMQDMLDLQVRFISIADGLDSADEDFEAKFAFAAARHGMAVPEAKRRVNRTATASFHQGGMVLKVGFGYRKLTKEEARSGEFGPVGLRETKLPEHTPIIQEIRRRLIETQSPMAVLAWLRKENIPVGPFVAKGRWTMQILKLLCCHPKLHGTRIFRRKIFTLVYSTGKFRRDSNPEPEQEYVPELAHMTREEQETMLASIGWRIKWNDCDQVRPSPRKGIPRYRSPWPSRSCLCGACQLPMVISGDHLRCPRCLKLNGRTCWNRVEVRLELMRTQVHAWLLQQFDFCPAARDVFVDAAWTELEQRRRKFSTAGQRIRAKRAQLKKQIRNVNRAIQAGGKLKSLVAELKKLEAKDKKLRRKLRKKPSSDLVESCLTKEDVGRCLSEILMQLMRHSYDFNQLMRRFIPEFVIVPVQALDTDQVHPRGKMRFVADPEKPALEPGNSIEVSFDLFTPPVHIGLLPKIQEAYTSAIAAGGKASYRTIAEKVGTSYMTVKRARAYGRLMQAANVTDPFRELREPPVNASRWHERADRENDAAA